MKYKKLLKVFSCFLLIGMIIFGSNLTKVEASTVSTNMQGLGYATNMAGDSYLSIKAQNIFEENWLKGKLSKVEPSPIGDTLEESYSSFSLEEFTEEVSSELYASYETEIEYSAIRADLKFSLGLSNNSSSTNAYSSYYYMNAFKYKDYYCSLNYNDLKKDEYINNLDKNYIDWLELLSKGGTTYEKFFDVFGTHVIMSGLYGGKAQVSETIKTKNTVINSSMQATLKANYEKTISSMFSSSTSASISTKLSDTLKTNDYEVRTRISATGGKVFSFDSSSQGSPTDTTKKSFREWKDSITNRADLIDIYDGGLIPLWDLLPTKYDDIKKVMPREFEKYNLKKLKSKSLPQNMQVADNLSLEYKLLRSNEIKVTDSGTFKQHIDNFNFTNFTGRSLEQWKDFGYTKVKVKIKADVKEVDDGYQYFLLYNEKTDSSDNKLYELKHEHVSGKKNTSYKQIEKDLFSGSGINLSKCREQMYLLYSASGKYDDDWKNKEVYLSFEFLK